MKKGRIVEFELPNDFYLNKEGILVSEISLERLNEIMDNITYLINDIGNLEERIDKTINYCKDSSKTIKSEYFSDVIKILKGDE